MNEATLLLAVLWAGLTLYALFGGADFGAGIWHLAASGRAQADQRELIEHTIGPVWEANHVWLIFVITLFWTAFPPAFAAFAANLYVPLTIVALGVIGRGAAFAFSKATARPVYALAFGVSSVVTPLVLGMIAGALASGRVPPQVGAADAWRSWLNPTSFYCGLLAVGSCAYLAAVYLTADARRAGRAELAEVFRRRALACGAGAGMVALAGLALLRTDAPELVSGLTRRGAPVVAVSLAAGLASIGLLLARWYVPARLTAAVTVAALLWGWGAAQYPVLLHPDLTVARASADPHVLDAVLAALAVSAVLLVPALGWLLAIFQRGGGRSPHPTASRADADGLR
jgi:cytochrome bd ubiquinol oxidase subunit II